LDSLRHQSPQPCYIAMEFQWEISKPMELDKEINLKKEDYQRGLPKILKTQDHPSEHSCQNT
jgi:hypothetical protein